ncbi:MAG: hypothetical protein JXB08_04305 [Bacilli bacterium]|nr:hypothetical protein [Bacilli bacterium]MBN2876191.1 hypothetical protein [Bacilli bacterium]
MRHKALILSIFILFLLILQGCGQIEFSALKVDMPLKEDETSTVDISMGGSAHLIQSIEEFNEFLDSEYLNPDFPQSFIAINNQYDENYFATKDLIAILYLAPSGSITDVTLDEIKIEDGKLNLYLSTTPNGIGTTDIGSYFTFYVSLDKITEDISCIYLVLH